MQQRQPLPLLLLLLQHRLRKALAAAATRAACCQVLKPCLSRCMAVWWVAVAALAAAP
jgi:hypothetical protein